MTFQVNPQMTALFGSETRVKVLGFLADAGWPKTGYQIAKAVGIKPPKVYREVRRLAEAGFLTAFVEPRRRLFILKDDNLRSLFLKSARIASGEDWFSPERILERRKAFDRAARIPVRLPPAKPNPKAIPNPWEYERPRAKGRALRRLANASGRK